MKLQILSAVLSLCLCTSSLPVAQAWQEVSSPQRRGGAVDVASELVACDETIPTPTEVYNAMIALKEQDAYKEGTPWTNDEPYSDSKGYYHWNGGLLDGKKISAVGCVAFSFILSDAAFGSLPARMYSAGDFEFSDIKVGDILRMNNDIHTVIVLEVSDTGVVIAEGNWNSQVHWGGTISQEVVMRDTSHYITRYPEDYVSPDDPFANDTIANGACGELTWKLTKAGTLTISGSGAIPDYDSVEGQPWRANSSQIRKVVIENGVTGIGSCAFWGCGVLSVEIPSSVTAIGNHAFRESSIISVNIPGNVKSIGDSAFRECSNLSSVTFSEGLESIDQNAFRGCTSLEYVKLPASLGKVGAGAFMDCNEMRGADFASGSKRVELGDNLFIECYNLMGVTLPKSIDKIGVGMFQNCKMLAGVEIPQGAESIGMQAFASSGVNVVIIPESVTSIGAAAFSACPLEKIYFTGTEEQWKSVNKSEDTASVVSKVTVYYGPLPTPTVSPDPTASPVPTQNPNPTASPAPTQNPGVTASPAPTAAPIPTEKPNPTTEPVPTEEPGPTGGPVTTEEPAPTEAPIPSGEPAPTEAPAPSGNPAPTEEPGPSGEPVPTEAPVPTQEPAPTTDPSPTQNPAPTAEPNPTQEPQPQPTAEPVPPTEPTPAPVPTPDTGIPFIKGESGKEGWEAIKEDAANAFEGEWVTVGMNGTSTVPGNVIESIKGMNATLAFDMGNGLVWSVNGKNITADQLGDVNLSIQAGTSAIPQHIVEGVAGSHQATQLSLAHSGYFGYNAVLMINMGADNAGQYANLFYYNESTEKLEFVTFGRIDEYGATELTFSHASNYVIVVGEDVMKENSDEDDSENEDSSDDGSSSKETDVHSPKTGDDIFVGGPNSAGLQQEGGMNLIGLLLIGAAVISALGTITFLIYRKEEKED